MKLPEIDAKVFYMTGKYVFFVVGLIGLIRVVDLWVELKAYDIFSSLAMALFYFIMAGFFSKLQKDNDVKEVTDDDILKIDKAINDLNLEEKKDAKKRRDGRTKRNTTTDPACDRKSIDTV